MPVMTVALDRLAASFANGVFQCSYALLLRGRCAGHVENLFLQDCSVQVVDTVTQRDLRKWQSKADPVSGQMVDIIEVDSAHRKIAQLLKGRGALQMGQKAVGLIRFESKRNKAGEPTSLILKLAQLAQMISPLRKCFDVSVKHGGGAAAS